MTENYNKTNTEPLDIDKILNPTPVSINETPKSENNTVNLEYLLKQAGNSVNTNTNTSDNNNNNNKSNLTDFDLNYNDDDDFFFE